ncbi:sensor histidine kinase [Clostridium sp.]|uniref:sensor histidine kinase n=1 Tax=Clostridium sp. TaxID=1506 RepID=UPI003995CBB6
MKNRWNKLGITKKIFIGSSTIIIISTILIYSCLYAAFPKVYSFYKLTKTEDAIQNAISNPANNSLVELNNELSVLAFCNNIGILVKDGRGNILMVTDGFFNELGNSKLLLTDGNIVQERFGLSGKVAEMKAYSQPLNEKLNIEIRIPMMPVKESGEVLILFLPIVVIITIIMAMGSFYIYSRLIGRPLLKINETAKAMAKLDFSKKIDIVGEDELGELSRSLNNMSDSLEESIRNLEESNKKLLSDIEKERIEEKKRRDFIATISHELKSPITIVSGQLEGMIYNIGSFKDRDKYLRKSYEVIGEMRGLVEEILTLNKYESDAFKVEMEKLNLSELLDKTIENQNFHLGNRGLNLKKNIESNINIYGDVKLIKRVLDNIINNAIKYSKDNTDIIVTLNKKEKATLLVENIGDNINEEEIKKIFDPFYRLEKSRNRKTGGSGLGLYIVKSILDKHPNMEYKMTTEENRILFEIEIEL